MVGDEAFQKYFAYITHDSECLKSHTHCLYCSIQCFNAGFYVLSGRIDSSEIQQSLSELGLHISSEDARKILQRFDLLFYALKHLHLQCVQNDCLCVISHRYAHYDVIQHNMSWQILISVFP